MTQVVKPFNTHSLPLKCNVIKWNDVIGDNPSPPEANESRDQLRPGYSFPKSKDPGYEVVNLLATKVISW